MELETARDISKMNDNLYVLVDVMKEIRDALQEINVTLGQIDNWQRNHE